MSQRLLNLVIKYAEVRGKPYNVLVQLAAAANSQGEVRLTVAELRQRTRSTDDASLYSALWNLQRLGYLQKRGQSHTQHAYFVVDLRAMKRDAAFAQLNRRLEHAKQAREVREKNRAAHAVQRAHIKGILDGLVVKYRRELR